MFSARELQTLAGACYREVEFLRQVEGCGVPTAIQQGAIAALRAKCIELAQNAAKAEEAAAKDKEEKKG